MVPLKALKGQRDAKNGPARRTSLNHFHIANAFSWHSSMRTPCKTKPNNMAGSMSAVRDMVTQEHWVSPPLTAPPIVHAGKR
eukprot:1152933-Pelagomonas_calceolata.AAC.2